MQYPEMTDEERRTLERLVRREKLMIERSMVYGGEMPVAVEWKRNAGRKKPHLAPEKVRAIREAGDSGDFKSYYAIAKHFEVSTDTVMKIIRRESYKYVD